MDSSFHGEVFDLQDLLSLIIIFRFRQLAITTAALALPLALLRRQRSTHSRRTSPSHLTSPPVRRAWLPRSALTQTLGRRQQQQEPCFDAPRRSRRASRKKIASMALYTPSRRSVSPLRSSSQAGPPACGA